ncbi:MAG: right-handed parallel beta-helix repeat-containing protein [Chitinivibrionales bacterium]|nr:right-handed parallel beta-helix repeat-containing protein [Chitinivibrionales bacterium]
MKHIAFFLLVLGISTTWSSVYYVDFVNGQNANSGKSSTSAWKNCPGDAAATQVPAQTILAAGDSVIFRGGIVYKGQITLKSSGSGPAAQITFDGNSAGSWGSGKALIDGENIRSYGFYESSGGLSYVTIKNFEIMNMKYTGVPWQGGAAVKIDDASFVTVADCYFHDVGYWKNDGSISPAGNGVHMLRPRNCVISGCEITRTGLAGIEVDGSVNCTFARNNIHDYITWGIDIGGDFNLCTGNVVCDNTIHDLYQYDNGYWGIPNDPNIPHTDYIFLRMGAGRHPVNNIIERNLFYNNQVFHEFGGTAMVFLSYADSTIMRNNIFINPHGYYATRFSWTSSGTKFYNNTIYAPGAITGSNGVGGVFLETNGYTDIRNNIIVTYQTSIATSALVDETGFKSDYNLFYNVVSSQDFVRISPARYATYAQWQTFGYDTHSLKATAITDIKFANVAGYPTACQSMDLCIPSTSPAVNAGTTLPGFTNDIAMIARPQGSAWDMGAHECVLNGAPPPVIAPVITTQPVNATVFAGQTATFTVAVSGTVPITYQWRRSNDNGSTWSAVSGATAASYTTAITVISDNNARFRCIATNAAGNAMSNAALLTVNPVPIAPGFTTQPVNATVFAGQTATFTVAVSGTVPITYQWQRSNDNGSTWSALNGATGASYTTATCVTADNGAKFRSLATNAAGSATSNAAILTISTPVVSKLTGTPFGTGPAWAPGSEFNKASDGDTTTFFEYALNNGGYTGIDLGSGIAGKITKIRFFPRKGFEFRMNGGKFQGSNLSSSSGYVDLYTIPATPPAGWNTIAITDQNSYRYLRYIAAANVYCNIAEMEFYGTQSGLAKQQIATSVLDASVSRALPKEFGLSAIASGNSSLVKVVFASPVALGETRFDLFDLQGRCLQSVVRHGGQAGYDVITFNNANRLLIAGMYLCRVETKGFNKSVVLLVR